MKIPNTYLTTRTIFMSWSSDTSLKSPDSSPEEQTAKEAHGFKHKLLSRAPFSKLGSLVLYSATAEVSDIISVS